MENLLMISYVTDVQLASGKSAKVCHKKLALSLSKKIAFIMY